MRRTTLLATAMVVGTALLTSQPAAAQRKSAQQTRAEQTQQIPVCAKRLGSIAVLEPENRWWNDYGLSSPEALIKLFVSKSKCFTLVDRNKGLNAMMGERGLAASGELRGRSNIGKGQIRAADYALVPDMISRNSNAGGTGIGAALGGLIGGRIGSIAGGLNMRRKTADVMLTVTDMRSSEQVAMAEGHAKKTDIGFSGGGMGLAGNLLAAGGAGLSSYSNTEIGQVVTLAYLQAYTNLINELGGLPSDPSASNSHQALEVQRPARMMKAADGRGGAVRMLDPGMLLYPTGNKQGTMWEVEDELGNKGWINSTLTGLAR
ncbi:peptidoglycan-binding protein [Lysobacter pythonis]|uniref:Peptidoglycan-binding protein n=1 Tax=Solilutibacter pythonis TaxID=2483112 RepID=A0A3M2HMI1_9GAMM|nr:CsgG/HfaB family protein [Lysobacter pythonis]RMH89093.1 peptidoglycan-binding protein [Lysobacter pythonis]